MKCWPWTLNTETEKQMEILKLSKDFINIWPGRRVYHRVSMSRVCPCYPGTRTEMAGIQTTETCTPESESDWTPWHRRLNKHEIISLLSKIIWSSNLHWDCRYTRVDWRVEETSHTPPGDICCDLQELSNNFEWNIVAGTCAVVPGGEDRVLNTNI